MARKLRRPCIYVLAGTNGAGKSSLGGAEIRACGADYFNPDEAARLVRAAKPDLTAAEANGIAWNEGKRLLERAIVERLNFALETTLGGATMTGLLEQAVAAGIDVRIWYVGLEGLALHVARVRARVAAGGHDVPFARIRERYETSRRNLIRLLPVVTEVRVFDNSREADPRDGKPPEPRLLLHVERGRAVKTCRLEEVPQWAKPILAAAMGSGAQ